MRLIGSSTIPSRLGGGGVSVFSNPSLLIAYHSSLCTSNCKEINNFKLLLWPMLPWLFVPYNGCSYLWIFGLLYVLGILDGDHQI